MALILIVEDDQLVRGYLKAVLDKEHLVIEAPDGEVALRLCERVKPNLTILDVHLNTGVSGKEVCKILSTTPLLAGMPILAVSGYDDRQAISDIMGAGATTFLAKPYTPDQLRQLVKVLLKDAEETLGHLLSGASEAGIVEAVREAFESGNSVKILRALKQGIKSVEADRKKSRKA
jgi:two-component system cell cycle response regulator DivK